MCPKDSGASGMVLFRMPSTLVFIVPGRLADGQNMKLILTTLPRTICMYVVCQFTSVSEPIMPSDPGCGIGSNPIFSSQVSAAIVERCRISLKDTNATSTTHGDPLCGTKITQTTHATCKYIG